MPERKGHQAAKLPRMSDSGKFSHGLRQTMEAY
jgi:hypothetical protein